METRHIIIVGGRHVGKTFLMERLLSHCTKPLSGFVTRSEKPDANGFHSIYIYPAGSTSNSKSQNNYIGTCNGRERQVNLLAFETLGVEYLQSKPGGIIAMDEVGFMETDAPRFQAALHACLEGDTHVIAAVKDRSDIPFLNEARHHPKAMVCEITEDSRDILFEKLLPYILSWNSEV